MDPAERALRQFRIIFNSVRTHFQQVERRSGLGGAQVWALTVIRDRPGISVNELAGALSVRQPTASNLVRGLAEAGLVEARREAVDKRRVQLHALPTAAAVLRRAPGPAAGVLPQALARLDSDVLERLCVDLDALIAELGTGERGADQPLALRS